VRQEKNPDDMSEAPLLHFTSVSQWASWLETHHGSQSQGVWLQFHRKDSGEQTFTHDEALDEALCYGWIDGQAKKHDAGSWLQKFTPRRPRSIWSKRNIAHVERLVKEGRMKPAGLRAVEEAKADGRWAQAYDSATDMAIPEDFMEQLRKDKKALAFFETLNRTNLYSIGWRLQTAKTPETRQRRMKKILDMLAKGEKFH
jgi:uncharacterized protein YdeI (YjbR/CyaY-like superfamily)